MYYSISIIFYFPYSHFVCISFSIVIPSNNVSLPFYLITLYTDTRTSVIVVILFSSKIITDCGKLLLMKFTIKG